MMEQIVTTPIPLFYSLLSNDTLCSTQFHASQCKELNLVQLIMNNLSTMVKLEKEIVDTIFFYG